MYYGFYTNSTIRHGSGGAPYDMQLAYIFTVGAWLIVCFFSLLFRCGGSAFLDSKLCWDVGKIQETQKFPRKQFLCSFDFLLLSDHSRFIPRAVSLDKEERLLCAFEETGLSEKGDAVASLGIWEEGRGWSAVPFTTVREEVQMFDLCIHFRGLPLPCATGGGASTTETIFSSSGGR